MQKALQNATLQEHNQTTERLLILLSGPDGTNLPPRWIRAELTRAEPSAGSFITYVETSLGPKADVATAVLVAVGYIMAIAGVFTMSGGWWR